MKSKLLDGVMRVSIALQLELAASHFFFVLSRSAGGAFGVCTVYSLAFLNKVW